MWEEPKRFTFAGHETFQCKSIWLKKGYDFVRDESNNFNNEDAVVYLGVGKNMVSSIRYWLKSFGIIDLDNNRPTILGDYIFGDNGKDPFLEDTNTLWLLHYQLVSVAYATIYRQLFLNYHKERKDFRKENVSKFVMRQFDLGKLGSMQINDNSLEKDIATLIKLYSVPSTRVYDDYSAALLDLNLLKRIEKDYYEFNTTTRAKIHPLIFLYAIKDIAGIEKVVPYETLLDLSLIFCLTQTEMLELFNEITKIYPNISYVNAAGEQLFTINEDITGLDILDKYYEMN